MKKAEKMLLIPQDKYTRIMDKISLNHVSPKKMEKPQLEEQNYGYINNPSKDQNYSCTNNAFEKMTDISEEIDSGLNNDNVNVMETQPKAQNENEITTNEPPKIVNGNPINHPLMISNDYSSNQIKSKVYVEDITSNDKEHSKNIKTESYVLKSDLQRHFPRVKWLKFD